MAEPADINVDELRRRARRRLVGAIVLALAAAVVVPMLLESDPKPLGDDVAVKIPPVDDGRFVNRLSEPPVKSEAIKAEPPAPVAKDVQKEAAPPAEASARRSIADAEKAVIAPPAKGPKYDTALPAEKVAVAAPQAPPVPSPPTASEPPSTPVVAAPAQAERKAQSTVALATESKAPQAPAAAEPPREGYAVQLAAYSDDKGANALANKLKRSGYPAYTEPLKTSRGTLWRVRVGPYPSRDAATGVRDKLKAEGQSGIVASAH